MFTFTNTITHTTPVTPESITVGQTVLVVNNPEAVTEAAVFGEVTAIDDDSFTVGSDEILFEALAGYDVRVLPRTVEDILNTVPEVRALQTQQGDEIAVPTNDAIRVFRVENVSFEGIRFAGVRGVTPFLELGRVRVLSRQGASLVAPEPVLSAVA